MTNIGHKILLSKISYSQRNLN